VKKPKYVKISKYGENIYQGDYLLPTSKISSPTSQRSRGSETLKDESEINTQMMIRENFGK
jgi:hypothetical protein